MYVIVVYVPKDHVDSVIHGLAEQGAGQIGKYRACAFKQTGEGQFEPTTGADPFIGRVGALERVEEVRVEMVCSKDCIRAALLAMLECHPYEEVAYHVIEVLTLNDFES